MAAVTIERLVQLGTAPPTTEVQDADRVPVLRAGAVSALLGEGLSVAWIVAALERQWTALADVSDLGSIAISDAGVPDADGDALARSSAWSGAPVVAGAVWSHGLDWQDGESRWLLAAHVRDATVEWRIYAGAAGVWAAGSLDVVPRSSSVVTHWLDAPRGVRRVLQPGVVWAGSTVPLLVRVDVGSLDTWEVQAGKQADEPPVVTRQRARPIWGHAGDTLPPWPHTGDTWVYTGDSYARPGAWSDLVQLPAGNPQPYGLAVDRYQQVWVGSVGGIREWAGAGAGWQTAYPLAPHMGFVHGLAAREDVIAALGYVAVESLPDYPVGWTIRELDTIGATPQTPAAASWESASGVPAFPIEAQNMVNYFQALTVAGGVWHVLRSSDRQVLRASGSTWETLPAGPVPSAISPAPAVFDAGMTTTAAGEIVVVVRDAPHVGDPVMSAWVAVLDRWVEVPLGDLSVQTLAAAAIQGDYLYLLGQIGGGWKVVRARLGAVAGAPTRSGIVRWTGAAWENLPQDGVWDE